jgi:hypothetical protein
MTISKQDADSFAEVFRSVAKLFANSLEFGSPTAVEHSMVGLDKLFTTLQSTITSSGGVEPYLAALIVTELQEAIAARHVRGG